MAATDPKTRETFLIRGGISPIGRGGKPPGIGVAEVLTKAAAASNEAMASISSKAHPAAPGNAWQTETLTGN